ncbi:putative AC9 transposase [Dissostichus eleginoides]|uniref:AC9 transposase n=1 Tax=Dissostichus eleginoides TaxID=100907 RepID=A0AAD9BVH6_DISEL|nr:putative AC9 transposase [Dissostichus eleginoides]
MTAHWIDPRDFHREKAAIACKRIKGRHTYDVIASEIEQIHSKFGLSHKVTATVTDNGSNFLKAFKVYEQQHPASDSDEGDEEDQVVAFTDVGEVLSTNLEQGQFSLPPHLRCASHTLNLISGNDVEKWVTSNTESKSVYRSATGKCSALWTKASRSTVASYLVEDTCRRKLIVPTSTRWNSFHDALSRITDIPIPELNTLCSRLGIKALTEREHQFLKEYCTVLKPLTVALDILQGEDNCYYGSLLPTLEILMSRTLALQTGLSRMTAGLPDAIVTAIKRRFAPVLDSRDALLAAVTLPKFKVRWLTEEERREAARALLTTKCRSAPGGVEPGASHQESAASYSTSSEKDFFAFDEMEGDPASLNSETEVIDYFKSVERLFSLGSLVLTPRRNRLSDKLFERLLLMRYNHCFSDKHIK